MALGDDQDALIRGFMACHDAEVILHVLILTPPKSNMTMESVLKTYLLLRIVIFDCHVRFLEGTILLS